MRGSISREDIDAVRTATDIAEIIGERVTLKGQPGGRFVGLCPFHSEKTPSFNVNPQGFYYCFGCEAKGDVFRFVERVDGLRFDEAVEWLAGRAGLTVRRDSTGRPRQPGVDRRKIADANAAAIVFYHDLLARAPDGMVARNYWKERGFDSDDARTFLVGYAPDGPDRLVRHLGDLGFTTDVLGAAGLARVSGSGRAVDVFQNRLVFPIHSQTGDAIAFGGRSLSDRQQPKYLNTANTALYAKERTLYNLHRARVAQGHEVVIVEGYTDVIALARAGVSNAVASCGTAFGEAHLAVLSRYGSADAPVRVVLAFDGDAAGQAASEKGFVLFGRFEAVDMRAAVLPVGMDPADFARSDPAAALAAVTRSVPLMEWKIERVLRGRGGDDPESRRRALRAAAHAIAVHPDQATRHMWATRVAERLGAAVPDVLAELRSARGERAARGAKVSAPAIATQIVRETLDTELVRVALIAPADVAATALAWPRDLLEDADACAALDLLGSVQRDVVEALAGDDPAAPWLGRVAAEDRPIEDPRVWAAEVFARLRQRAARRAPVLAPEDVIARARERDRQRRAI